MKATQGIKLTAVAADAETVSFLWKRQAQIDENVADSVVVPRIIDLLLATTVPLSWTGPNRGPADASETEEPQAHGNYAARPSSPRQPHSIEAHRRS